MGRTPAKRPSYTRYIRYLAPLAVLHVVYVLTTRPLRRPPRFSTPPWTHPLPLTAPLDPTSALLTPIPEELPDGLGHRFAVINYELLLARALSVRHLHRVARYDSLTRRDPRAVDRLFGWAAIVDTRARALSQCRVDRRPTNCTYRTTYPLCVALNHAAEFRRLVNIPPDIVDCVPTPLCWQRLKSWAAGYGPYTLFQLQSSRCHEDYRNANFVHTRAWFRNWYWDYHRVVRLSDSLSTRVSLDEKRFQVGVHVRRGDFLNDTSREVIPDGTYADVVCVVKRAVDEVLGNDVPTDVHVFSEGVPKDGFLSRHDIDIMRKLYVTETGFAVKPLPHWRRLVGARCAGDVHVVTHIATDTVGAIHDMIAADVFVGSRSGLSVHIVNVISRGVTITPVRKGPPGKVRIEGDWQLMYDYHNGNGTAIVNAAELRSCLTEMKRDERLRGIQFR